MCTTDWLRIAMFGLLITGCAGISTAPTTESRQALAPSGKLRVGLQLGSPHNVIRDPASGEMKGVGFDLGKELARRLGQDRVDYVPLTTDQPLDAALHALGFLASACGSERAWEKGITASADEWIKRIGIVAWRMRSAGEASLTSIPRKTFAHRPTR